MDCITKKAHSHKVPPFNVLFHTCNKTVTSLYLQEKKELERMERERELKKEAIAEKEAVRVFAKESGNTSNPGLATDL